jgi:outer membrane receptor for ferrienterochelin and colicin
VREIKETYSESQSWKNRGLNFTFDHIWNKEWKSEVSLSFAGNEIIQDVASIFTRTFPIREDKITSFSNSFTNSINGTHLKAKAIRSLDNYKLILGYEYTANTTLIDVMVDDSQPLKVNAEGVQHALFGSYESTLFNRLHFRLGLRSSYYELDDNLYLSPRVDLNYKITEQLYAKAAISKYYQFTQVINYEDRFARSIDLWIVNNGQNYPIASSNHQMLGLRWLNKWFDLDIELYRKNTYGFLQFSSTNVGFDDDGRPVSNTEYQRFVGNNINQGIDFTIKRSFKNYTGWIAYTLSEANHQISNVNEGNPFPSQMDQRHQFKFINQIQVGDFEISANYLFSSGRPFLDLSKLRNSRVNRSSDLSDFFTSLKNYQRADLSVAYKFNIDKAKARVGFSVFNLFDRENIKYKQFIYTTPVEFQTSDNNSFFSNELKLLGRTLNVHFKIDI